MMSGIPVVTFDIGSNKELVKDKETGYVAKSFRGLVSALKKVNKIDRNKCRTRAEKYFSVEKMVDGYEKVYRKLVN